MPRQFAAETFEHFIDDGTISDINSAVNLYDLFIGVSHQPLDCRCLAAVTWAHHDKRLRLQLLFFHLYLARERN
jgi:hypothetical protein